SGVQHDLPGGGRGVVGIAGDDWGLGSMRGERRHGDDDERHRNLPGDVRPTRRCDPRSGPASDVFDDGAEGDADGQPYWRDLSVPPSASLSSTANFAFMANEAGSTFACSLDGGAFTACVSPKSYTGLTNANHNFLVQATDAANNTDPTPASYSWTINLGTDYQ